MTARKQAQWQQTLVQSRQALLTLLNQLTPAQWQTIVFSENEPWTITTMLAHLIESERGMSIHIHKIRKGEATLPPGFDLHSWNAGIKQRMGEPTPAELLAQLESTRAKTLAVLSSLQEGEWALSGQHPSRGVITIEQYYETIAGHEHMHEQDIQRALT